jgi:ubiquinone/menaquinone biosynthesis C-methylase UbiE
MAEVGIDANAVYSLGANAAESARLQQQSDELAEDSSVLLDRMGLRPGHHVIDLGCGPRGIIDLLCERVLPGGRVVGVDADPAHVAMANQFVADEGFTGTEIILADARGTSLEANSFDLVHARTLLINVPRPDEVLAEMVRLARPGGQVASMEPDTETAYVYPPLPAYERVCELFPIVFGRNGADPRIGRRLGELYRDAGLEDVAVEARIDCRPPGHSRRTIRADLIRSMRPRIVEMGLANEDELARLDADVRAHVTDPRTIVVSSLFFLVSGRKPA